MSTSVRRQASITWALLFAVAAVVDLAGGHDRPDDASFRAGYSAGSNAAHDSVSVAPSGMRARSVCDALLDRRLVAAGASQLVEQDFVSGCRRAIAETTE